MRSIALARQSRNVSGSTGNFDSKNRLLARKAKYDEVVARGWAEVTANDPSPADIRDDHFEGIPTQLVGADLENTLTLVATSDAHCDYVRDHVPVSLYGSRIVREIVDKIYAFIDEYGKAPKDHLPDLVEDRLYDGVRDQDLYLAVLHNIHALTESGNFNEQFARNQVDHFVRLQLLKEAAIGVVKAAEQGELDDAEAALDRWNDAREAGSTGLQLIPASTIRPEAVEWIWPDWIAAGMLHMLVGQPGSGKTGIAMHFAATLTAPGRRYWPDGARRPTTKFEVVIWSGGDNLQTTLIPRLIAAGADLDRIHFVTTINDPRSGVRYFDPTTRHAELAPRAEGAGEARA
jgi:hypothetical protein